MRTYETTIILDPTFTDEKVEEVIKKIEGIITHHQSEVKKVDRMGKRKLAYDVRKRAHGIFVMIEFHGSGNITATLEHEYRLMNDLILRYLTVAVDPKVLTYREHRAKMAPPVSPETVPTTVSNPAPPNL